MGNDNHPYHGGQDRPVDLGQQVDWMTYSHQRLWEMINTGVDLKAASNAQADWITVSQALADVRELLANAIDRSSRAWEGETADRAREALESVEKWALNTSEHAENVAKCIGTEIDHVQTARELMPPPAPAPPVVTPVGGTAVAPVPAPAPVATAPRSTFPGERVVGDRLVGERVAAESGYDVLTPEPTASSRRTSPFTGIDAIAAPAVESVVAADATHRQAAEVMAMFQQNSYAVDRTVPSFSPPTNPVAPPPPPVVAPPVGTTPPPSTGGGDGGPVVLNNGGATGTQGRQQEAAKPGGRVAGGTAQSGRGGFAGRGTGGFGGRGGVPAPVTAGGAGGGGALPTAPGPISGAVTERGGSGANPGSVTSSFQAPKAVTPQAGMIGAAPIAAPPPVAGGGGNERDHNRPNYLEDDENVFGVDRKAAPPVIGL
ncbi:PPE domain-containing protein [Saccharothrix syringae]|uniref:PPE domain-containing protein n=1 Tax=Saccharothrix syringae TaxID=103733 RepID=A0A5Q0GQE8_SACSY|nr:PPE domain-containing protein [Saccharothrix syringae]QFZ16199.1 PPE domain-containing protein [Saccharothrix syringae]